MIMELDDQLEHIVQQVHFHNLNENKEHIMINLDNIYLNLENLDLLILMLLKKDLKNVLHEVLHLIQMKDGKNDNEKVKTEFI